MLHITRDMFEMNAPQPICQGEVTIWHEDFAPPEILKAAKECKYDIMKLENDRMIVGHSETGHCHVIEPVDKSVPLSEAAQAMIDQTNDLFISLKIHHDSKVEHLKNFDTHDTFMLSKGNYIIRPDDEQSVDGWVRSTD